MDIDIHKINHTISCITNKAFGKQPYSLEHLEQSALFDSTAKYTYLQLLCHMGTVGKKIYLLVVFFLGFF